MNKKKHLINAVLLLILCTFFLHQSVHATEPSTYGEPPGYGEDYGDGDEAIVEITPVSLIGIITQVDRDNNRLHVLYPVDGTDFVFIVDIENENIADMHQLQVGNIVDFTYNLKGGGLLSLEAPEPGQIFWEYPTLTDLEIDEYSRTIAIAHRTFSYLPGTVIRHSGTMLNISDIQPISTVMMRGIGDIVWFINVIELGDSAYIATHSGYLDIRGVQGASVHIDGESVDATRPIYLEFGLYRIEVRRTGYEPYGRQVNFKEDGQIEQINLIATRQQDFAFLPTWFWVFIVVVIFAIIALFVWLGYEISRGRMADDNAQQSKQHDSHGEHDERDIPNNERTRQAEIPQESVIIEARGLKTLKYENKNEVNFDVHQGDLIYIVGESGSGKTVLLKMLAGCDKKTSGRLKLFGGTWRKDGEQLKEHIGYVPQIPSLYSGLTPIELLTYYSKLFPESYRIPVSEDQKKRGMSKIEYILRLVGLLSNTPDKNKASKKIGDLSGGEKKRVSIAIELLRSPRVLLLDEPDSGLDPKRRDELYRVLEVINNTGTTIILSTHYQDKINRSADRKMKIFHGRNEERGYEDGVVTMWRKGQTLASGTEVQGAVDTLGDSGRFKTTNSDWRGK